MIRYGLSFGLLLLLFCGCANVQQNVERTGRWGYQAGQVTSDLVIEKHGVVSTEVLSLARLGQNLNRMAGLLAADEPISTNDMSTLSQLIKQLQSLDAGDQILTAEVTAIVLGYVREVRVTDEARTYLAVFCRKASEGIYERISWHKLTKEVQP